MSFRAFARPARRVGRQSFHGGRFHRPRRAFAGQFINPDRFIQKAAPIQEEQSFVPTNSFGDFGLIPALTQALLARGYTQPTAVQDQAIPHVMNGRDLIGLADTGTGKTAAFVLPLIHRLKTVSQPGTALIVAPTRELAVQINDEFRAFSRGLNLFSALCVGGTSIGRQINELKRHPQVVVGTPGRLKDLLQRRVLQLGNVRYFVLDEADRMLDMGFIRDIRELMRHLPAERQSLCLSATITPKIKELLAELLRNPVTVSVKTGETSGNVEQDVIRVGTDQKIERLTDLLRTASVQKALIFGQTKWGVQKLADTLSKQGIRSEAIHGNKSQAQRQRALDAFKANRVMALVATDVAARGLDIPNVSHVINFDQPMTFDDYIHRIGRTGRAGRRGYALTFVS